MQIGGIGLKDVLDWTIPLVLGWIGSGVRKYLRAMQIQMREGKESIIQLNIQIAKILERVESQGREIDSHEKRLQHVEHSVTRRNK